MFLLDCCCLLFVVSSIGCSFVLIILHENRFTLGFTYVVCVDVFVFLCRIKIANQIQIKKLDMSQKTKVVQNNNKNQKRGGKSLNGCPLTSY